ncbi:hypothetical protein Tco_1194109 [Tanacetum coccineum]
MTTQQDIYVVVSKNRPLMPAKDEFTEVEAKQVEANDQEKEVILLNELDYFTSVYGESIESYYHIFAKPMNDLDRNKLTRSTIATNIKFLNHLQLEWKCNVTIVKQTTKNQIDGNPYGNVVALVFENYGNGQNPIQIRLLLFKKEEVGLPLTAEEIHFLAVVTNEDEEEVELHQTLKLILL